MDSKPMTSTSPEMIETEEIKNTKSAKFDFEKFITLVWLKKKLELRIIASATILAIIISFLLPNYYESTAIVLPQTDQGILSNLGSLSNLASIAGLNVGETPLEQLYPTIVNSEIVLKEVIYNKYSSREFANPVNLIQYWDIDEDDSLKNYDLALKKIRKELDISLDSKTNTLTASIRTKEPQLSADIINQLIDQMDFYIRTEKRTNASEQRKWIESRLKDVSMDLEHSEDSLEHFREKNRAIGDSPALLLEQSRLSRRVDINTDLFTTLTQQYEMARIEEIKNIPVINIMDRGRPAGEKASPKRLVIIISVFLLSLAGSVWYVYAVDHYRAEINKALSFIAALRRM